MYEYRPAIVWILIIIMIIPATGNSFDELNNAYVSSVSQLPAIEDLRLKPDMVEQSSGHIKGWIDIVGFKECARVNETNYIGVSSEKNAVIRYNAWGKEVSVDSVIKTITVSRSENNTIARMNIVLKWHYYYSCNCNKNGCSTCRKDVVEKAAFYDSELSPTQYPDSSIPQLILHEFPNSSKALLEVNTDDKVTSFKIATENGSVIRHIQIGQVVYTAKGIPYANFTKNLPVWDSTGKGAYHQGDDITLDSSNFSFSAMTPFETINATNMTVIQEQPSSISMLNILIFIMLGMGYATCKLAWKASQI